MSDRKIKMTAEGLATMMKGQQKARDEKKKKKKSGDAASPKPKGVGIKSGIKSNAESLRRQHKIAKYMDQHAGGFKVHKADLDILKKKFSQ